MFTLLLIFHVLASIVLIMVVLLQSGKAGDLASAFGGAGTQTAFGARAGTTFLSKATTVCAVIFMVTSLGLSITFLRSSGGGTIMQGVKPPVTNPAPPANPAQRSGGSPTQGQNPAPAEQRGTPAGQAQPQGGQPQQPAGR